MKNDKGFTLVELLVVLAILGILLSFSVGFNNNYKERLVLEITAYEIRNALQLAQQLSIDESRSFNFEIIGRDYLVKENLLTGRVILRKTLPDEIRVKKSEQVELSFHARYSAKAKIYRYRIFTGEYILPFAYKYIWHPDLLFQKQCQFLYNNAKSRNHVPLFHYKPPLYL